MTNEQQRKDIEEPDSCQDNELKTERKTSKVTFSENYIITVKEQEDNATVLEENEETDNEESDDEREYDEEELNKILLDREDKRYVIIDVGGERFQADRYIQEKNNSIFNSSTFPGTLFSGM